MVLRDFDEHFDVQDSESVRTRQYEAERAQEEENIRWGMQGVQIGCRVVPVRTNKSQVGVGIGGRGDLRTKC